MKNRIYRWQEETGPYRAEIESVLGGSEQLLHKFSFEQVAFGFPSEAENPYYLDIPLIDWPVLDKWALERGWKVGLEPGDTEESLAHRPNIEFCDIKNS